MGTTLGSRDLSTGSVLAERDLGIFPAEWFDALYPKTGVTGPYMALLGVSTFLASKEFFVIEHDAYAGLALAIVLTGIIKNVGPSWAESINKEAVGLQLEAEYRDRLSQAHQQVKKRLDYQLETANVMRRMEQKHMVDWIIGNVKASITPAQEAAALKKCISDLKALAA